MNNLIDDELTYELQLKCMPIRCKLELHNDDTDNLFSILHTHLFFELKVDLTSINSFE